MRKILLLSSVLFLSACQQEQDGYYLSIEMSGNSVARAITVIPKIYPSLEACKNAARGTRKFGVASFDRRGHDKSRTWAAPIIQNSDFEFDAYCTPTN